ncbi:hypothetical protein BJ978_000530 [Agromyces terreus]|uniref:SHOCT domain-containing protein n=1 Tax=Agromyces terreus TaxID=424795 RepID=A0A9X2H5N0_9MICO|nr:SHOCT domain-containing protein [Agromyces terreus]MCP2369854.1 hypothetical protein [Agromyces terreus]
MPDDYPGDPLLPGPFDAFAAFGAFGVVFGIVFVLVSLVVATVFVVVIVSIVRNARRAKASGHDLMTMETDLAVRALDSDLLAPAEGIEARLARVDALRRAGTISEAEHAQARAAILASA